ncbi:hypothetical protein QML37_30685, partial [Klebsiella pneumoniae]|uniref:hypothetical protein n=1 Tax=Klebsiella pneumoniae TaxID=573 RepID=UPI003A7FB497
MAPKCYHLQNAEGDLLQQTPDGEVLVYKGAGKIHVTGDWFYAQYQNQHRKSQVLVDNFFRIQWETMTIHKKTSPFTLGIPDPCKRVKVYNKDGLWVDTDPIHIKKLPGATDSVQLLIGMLEQEIEELKRPSKQSSKDNHKHHEAQRKLTTK